MILNYTKVGFDRKSSSEMSVKVTKRFKIIFLSLVLVKNIILLLKE